MDNNAALNIRSSDVSGDTSDTRKWIQEEKD